MKIPENKTLGYYARQAREKGQRRIARLEEVISDRNISADIRSWAKQQKKEISSAMQGTRKFSKTGKRYKSKTDTYISNQIDRLNEAVNVVPATYTVRGNTNRIAEQQINMASSRTTEKGSIYTKKQVKIFYKATKDAWYQEGISVAERNQAILDYYNSKRVDANGKKLRPLTLGELFDKVMEANELAIRVQEVDPRNKLTGQDAEDADTALRTDNEDFEKSYGENIDAAVVKDINDALDNMLQQPNLGV